MNSCQKSLICALAVTNPSAAYAEEVEGWRKGDIVISAGIGATLFSSSAKISLGGNPISDGNIKLSNNAIVGTSIEYFVSPELSVALVGGLPPTTKVTGTGSLASSGELGRVKYGLATLVGRYHFNATGRLSPYLGAGVSRFIIFSTTDGSVSGLKGDDAWAPVAQAGMDYHLTSKVGIFATATYIPVKSQARGTARGLPLIGNAVLKSKVLKAGLTYRF